MSELKLQDAVIEIKDLPSRAKALDGEGQDNVFGGYFRRRPQPRTPRRPIRQFGRPQPHAKRRVPVYAFRRVQVGWRFV